MRTFTVGNGIQVVTGHGRGTTATIVEAIVALVSYCIWLQILGETGLFGPCWSR